MKRQMILFLGIVALFLASSCEKPISDHKGDGVSGEDTYTITIDFKPPVVLQTKSGLSYDKVDRLDVFYFDSKGAPIDHKTFVGNDVLSNRLSFTMKEGSSIFFTFFANLPEELAGYLSHMSRGQMLSYAVFPLEEMDRLDYPIMCATKSVYFSKDQDVSIELYRYTYSIEVGKITADFEVDSMRNKEIFIKRIVLTNCANKCDLIYYSNNDSPQSLYGNQKNFDYDIFGGGNTGYAPGQAVNSGGGSFSLGYDGIIEEWSRNYKNMLNNNVYNSTANHISISSTGAASDHTIITFDNNSGIGIIGVMDDNSLETVISVGKRVTGLPANYDAPMPMNRGTSAQDNTPKLVIEVLVDGQTLFYPIQIAAPQPNTLYRIDNIILKGAPSPYCNCYPPVYDLSTGTSVSILTETIIKDIVVGENPETGELVNIN